MDRLEILFTETEVDRKISQIAGRINHDYAGRELLVVGILRGAFIFMADLVRKLTIPVIIDFMAVSSYGTSTQSSGVVRIIKDLDESVEGRHLLLVEDIIDSGLTLKYLIESLKARHPASLKVCTLLDKPERRQVELVPDYNGFTIPDYFIVGFGLDYQQSYRNLPGVYYLRTGERTSRPEEGK